jgi:5-formyltetrahydrofolate cyclo-ligase
MPDFPVHAERAAAAKVAVRTRLLTARTSLSAAAQRSAAVAVQAATIALVRAQRPATVTAYVPTGAEPGGADLPAALAGALPSGGRLLLPVLLPDDDLDWAAYEGPGSLRPGRRGIAEPAGRRLGVAAIAGAQLIVVPALAVDRAGHRLGRGGGSYDRALARATAGFTVALLHDGEFLDRVPAEPHDRRVRAAITPSGGLSLSEGDEWTK